MKQPITALDIKATRESGVMRAWPLILVLLAPASAWALLFATVPPASQNFPLIDDWAFARGVREFAKGQGVHYIHWASMPQLGQWLWAVPFLWAFDKLHVALRLSTIVLSWLGLAAFYDLLRQENLGSRTAAFATAVLALNPLFFLLEGTFMTDVPALSFALIALALYGRAIKSGRWPWLLAGTAVATLAVVTRQNMVLVPIVAGLMLMIRQPSLRRAPGWLLTIAVPVAIGVGTEVWFRARPDIKPMTPHIPLPTDAVALVFVMLHFCGLAALPLLVLHRSRYSWSVFAIALGILGAGMMCCMQFGRPPLVNRYFPYVGGVVTVYGADGSTMVGPRQVLVTEGPRALLTVLGCLAGAGFLATLFDRVRADDRLGLLPLFALFQVPFILIVPMPYDRYFLVLLPGVLCLTATCGPAPRWRQAAALVLVLPVAAVSIALMHDWLAWNSALWKLGERQLARSIDPWDIEGGFEWDGWHAPDVETNGLAVPPKGPRLFRHVSGHYAISFTAFAVTLCLDVEPYRQWLPPGEGLLYFIEFPQRRESISPAGAIGEHGG
jgi:hypothetical protein